MSTQDFFLKTQDLGYFLLKSRGGTTAEEEGNLKKIVDKSYSYINQNFDSIPISDIATAAILSVRLKYRVESFITSLQKKIKEDVFFYP